MPEDNQKNLEKFENFVDGSRTDPREHVKDEIEDEAHTVLLNLGDKASTIIVNEFTTQIVLLNKLVEWRSNRELEVDENGGVVEIDKSGGDGVQADGAVDTIAFDDEASGFGIHIAAAHGDASDNKNGEGPKLDGNGYERGHEAKKIDVKDASGNVSDELITLFQIAARGGKADADDRSDTNLRLGFVGIDDEGVAKVEIIVDGKWSSDILSIEGSIAEDLLNATFVDTKNPNSETAFRFWGDDDFRSIFIGNDADLISGEEDGFIGARDVNRTVQFETKVELDDDGNEVEVVVPRTRTNNELEEVFVRSGNGFSADDAQTAITAGVLEFLTDDDDLFPGLAVEFGEDGLAGDTVEIMLSSPRATDTLFLVGSGVETAIQNAGAALENAGIINLGLEESLEEFLATAEKGSAAVALGSSDSDDAAFDGIDLINLVVPNDDLLA